MDHELNLEIHTASLHELRALTMLGRKTALADLDQLEVVNTRPAPPDDHPARPLALRRPLRTAEHVWILNAKGTVTSSSPVALGPWRMTSRANWCRVPLEGNTQAHGWVIVPNGKVAGTWKLMVTHRLQVRTALGLRDRAWGNIYGPVDLLTLEYRWTNPGRRSSHT